MWVLTLRDKLWNIVRWDIQDKAYWSTCNATVLFEAAKKCAEGHRVLGYSASDPPPNHDERYYKDWITKMTNQTLSALSAYHFLDGSVTRATPVFEQAAGLVRPCAAAFAANAATDEPRVQPAAS